MFVGYADDHTGDVYRFIHTKIGQIILSRDVRWLNIMWNAYMKKQRRLCQNLEESYSDSDFDSEDGNNEFHDDNKLTNTIREEEEDQKQDSKPTAQERRLGLDIYMRGTREPNLGSTRCQAQRLRSPFESPMKEHADQNLDDWVPGSCFMSALTSD